MEVEIARVRFANEKKPELQDARQLVAKLQANSHESITQSRREHVRA